MGSLHEFGLLEILSPFDGSRAQILVGRRRCVACGGFVGVWAPPSLRIEPGGTVSPAPLSEQRCHNCRQPTATVGPDLLELRRLMARVSGIPDGVTLLVLYGVGAPATKPAGFVATNLMVECPLWPLDGPTTPRNPVLRFAPTDEAGAKPATFVVFASFISTAEVPGAVLHVVWPFPDPNAQRQVELITMEDPAPAGSKIAKLWDGGLAFYDDHVRRVGRPAGSFDRGPEWYAHNFKALALRLGHRPTQQEFLGANRLSPETMKRNLKHFGLWPWERFASSVLDR